MASIYDLKPAFQSLLRPLANALARSGVTANSVTISAVMLSAAVGLWLALCPRSRLALAAVPVVLFARMALNAIDGMLAREHNMKSSRGAVLNELGDVVSDALLYLPFALIPGLHAGLVVCIVVVAVMVEMAGVIGVQIGASRRYDGPMGKSDRAFVFSLLALALAFSIEPGMWSTVFLAAVLALSVLTVVRRARRAQAELRR